MVVAHISPNKLVQFWWVVTCWIMWRQDQTVQDLHYFVVAILLLMHCFFFCCWISGWKIVRNYSQQYSLVALKGNDTYFCSGGWRGNGEPDTFCIHWKNFLTDFWIMHFPTQWFLAKRTMWDSVIVIWPFVTFYVMKLSMSKEFNCIFLQNFDRCDERP
jgi:hypothetical protein